MNAATNANAIGVMENERKGSVMWFRAHDVRANDNEAFVAAAKSANANGGAVACVFVWSEDEEGVEDARARGIGAASRVWLHHALRALDGDVRRAYGGAGLQFHRGTYAEALIAATRAVNANVVYASARYEPAQREIDAAVEARLREANIEFRALPGYVLFEPASVRLDMANERYFFGTLMPYVHAAERCGRKPGKPVLAPAAARLAEIADGEGWTSRTLDELGLVPRSDAVANWSAGIREEWDISEAGAREAWETFARVKLERFEDEHGRADVIPAAVSRLSPYLRFGQISARTLYHEMSTTKVGGKNSGIEGRKLSRLFWHRLYRREFAYWQLHNWPELATTSVRSHYERRDDWGVSASDEDDSFDSAEALKRWQTGTTGFPTVDAGMRRLWATGWMHQTERMIAATFLVDYCGVHWTHGARWFHDTLVDADLAINSMMWQNAGKSGLDQWDVFSGALVPDGSSRAHDPHGDAVARWIPELSELPSGHLRHRPWEASAKVLKAAGVELGVTYPNRIMRDPERARLRMLRGVNEARVVEVRKAEAAAAAASPDIELSSRSVDVLVDVRTGNDFVLIPPGATKDNAGALLPVSTRKEFKKELKSAPGVRAAMMSAQIWSEKALDIGITGAGRGGDASSDETGFARAGEIGKKRAVRAEKIGQTHSHSHGVDDGDHGHSHGTGRKTTGNHGGKPGQIDHRSSSWARTGSKRAVRGLSAAEAERKAVKAGRRESKELAARTAGLRADELAFDFEGEDAAYV